MADEEAKMAAAGGGSASNIMTLGVILIAILAVFMVISLNTVKSELVKMNKQIETLVGATNNNSLGTFQAVDAEGNMQWRFQPVPMQQLMGEGTGCGAGGSCGSCPSVVAPPTK